MRYALVHIFLLCHALASVSQPSPWYLTKGLATDEVAWAVDVDGEGNVYWAIEQKDQFPFWYFNIVLFKFDADGQPVWQSSSWGNGTGFNDIAFVAKAGGDHFYLAGRTDSTASTLSGDALLMSFNTSTGNLDWAKNITPNPDFGYQEIDGISIQTDGIYLTGWTKGQTSDVDFLIQKTGFSGSTAWLNSWDYNSLGKFDGANGQMAMDGDFIYAAGHVNRSSIISLDGD
ncbi:MAG: hypothetical protein AAB316_23780, partial [Bacteroidota bacterium]